MGGTSSNPAAAEDGEAAPIRGGVFGKFFADVQSGNLKAVRIAIEQTQIDVNKKDVNGRPAIFVAAEYNKLEIVQYLTSVEGIDVNAIAKEGNSTPVRIAAAKGYRDIVEFLLLHGANPLDADIEFHYGASIGNLALVKQAVVEKHVDINQTKEDGKTALYSSAVAGYVEVVEYLAGLEGIELNNGPNLVQSKSPIQQAAFHGHDAVVTCLLQHGATPLDPVSAFLFASKNGNLAVVQQALQASPDNRYLIDADDERNQTAVYWAAKTGHVVIVEYLLSMGAITKLTDLLIVAAENGRVIVVDYLLKNHNVDINHVDEHKNDALTLASERGTNNPSLPYTPSNALSDNTQSNQHTLQYMMLLLSSGHADVVTCLLSHGVHVSQSNSQRQGCLLVAAGRGHLDVVDIFLQHQQREDVNNFETDEGKFALWLASEYGHASVVQSLIKNNANVNQVTKLGQSSLWIAANNGHTATVDCLLTNGADANQVCLHDGSMVRQEIAPTSIFHNLHIMWPCLPSLTSAMSCRVFCLLTYLPFTPLISTLTLSHYGLPWTMVIWTAPSAW